MECQSVTLMPLDEVSIGRVDFMKVDVEGAEMRVFRGAQRTLEDFRPIMLSEISPAMLERVSVSSTQEFFAFFQKLEYRCFIIDPQRLGEELRDYPSNWPKPLMNIGLIPAERCNSEIDKSFRFAPRLTRP
jgi:hypothetical protein